MAEENLEYQLAQKVVGSLIRAGVLAGAAAYGTYIAAKTGVDPSKVVDPESVKTFAESATQITVALVAGVVTVGFSIWEKLTTSAKVETLKTEKEVLEYKVQEARR